MKKPRPRKGNKPRQSGGRSLQSKALNPLSTSALKADVMLWIGAISALLTLFGSFQAFLDIADWASYITTHWNYFMEYFWVTIFGFPKGISAPATFSLSLMIMALSANNYQLHKKTMNGIPPLWDKVDTAIIVYLQWFCIITSAMFLFRFAIEIFVLDVSPNIKVGHSPTWVTYLKFITATMGWLFVASRLEWREIVQSVVLTTFVVLFYVIIAYPGAYAAKSMGGEHISAYRDNVLEFSVWFMPVFLIGLLLSADVRQLNSRFKYILLALATFLVLSMVSAKGISLKPPAS